MLESVAGRIFFFFFSPQPSTAVFFLLLPPPPKAQIIFTPLASQRGGGGVELAWKTHLLPAPGIRADTLLMERVCGRERGHDSPPAVGSGEGVFAGGGSTWLITALSLLPAPLRLIKPASPSLPCSF